LPSKKRDKKNRHIHPQFKKIKKKIEEEEEDQSR
jgi:hypothetical protein